MTEESIVRRSEGPVSWITLNRPDRLNALVRDMRERLADAVEEAAERAETRVIIITGSGRGFCAGADVEAMAELVALDDRESFGRLVQAGMRVIRRIREAPQPVVAAVNGAAVGAGASLAIACDLRIASDRASIGFTFNRIGLHPDWGATFFLPRLVGTGRASELILTGRIVGAAEAERLGLFERIVPADEFDATVESLARELSAKPALAVTLAKRSLGGDIVLPVLEEALRMEAEAQMACFRSVDVREGIAAFFEKRPPRFTGEHGR